MGMKFFHVALILRINLVVCIQNWGLQFSKEILQKTSIPFEYLRVKCL